jgi:type I restriction enzyme M protein
MSKVKTTEGEFRGQVVTWLNSYLKDNPCPFELVTADPSIKISDKETNFPDVQFWINRKAGQGFCGLELKTVITAADDPELLESAIKKAHAMKARYFVTWNMRDTIIWETPNTGVTITKENRKKAYSTIPNINSADDLWDRYASNLLQTRTMELLHDLVRLYRDGHLYEIDVDATFFVKILSEATKTLQPHVHQSLLETIGKNPAFRKGLYDWAIKQAIANYEDESFYQVVAYQIVYRLFGKILFYQTLRRFKEDELPPMNLRHIKPSEVQEQLGELFAKAQDIDYQAVFEIDFPDIVRLPEKSIDTLVNLVEELNKRNFSRMPQDVIGQVFEQLIPPEERHNLGQYFTREDLVDLICAFCVQKAGAKVFDPTCGTGTFLIRAYDRLKNFGEYDHKKLLSQLWGIDIAPFPAELATINLYRQNLADYANFPKIIAMDAFAAMPNQTFEFPSPKLSQPKQTVSEQIPTFDAIVGNFPYIRQELIERQLIGYKNQLDKVLTIDWGTEYGELFDRDGSLLLSGQADIYTYLFFHVAKFLNENNGRIGIVTSSAWLEVDYGHQLQKFFLKNFKVIAILESLVENWFEDVPIITAVTVLERCKNKDDRDNNAVKFVKLKKPLKDIFPQDYKITSNHRWKVAERLATSIERIGLDRLVQQGTRFVTTLSGILNHEDDEIRVRALKQGELLNDIEKSGKTAKWGIHIRAPDVYYEIVEKCKNELIKLGDPYLADLRYGLKSGINEFFFLDDKKIKHWGIEKEYLKPVVTSPKEIDEFVINPKRIKYKVFYCHDTKTILLRKKAKGALNYIEWGENQVTKERGKYKKGNIPYPKVSSVINRKLWYDVSEREPGDFMINQFIRERFFFPINIKGILASNVVFEGQFKNRKNSPVYLSLLNSSLVYLFVEITGRFSMGDGFLTFYGPDIEDLPIPNAELIQDKHKTEIVKSFNELLKRPIKVISDEVKMKDRQRFDAAVLKAIGLNAKKYLPLIYNGLTSLVKERQELGAMRRKTRKIKVERDIERLYNEVLKEILPDGIEQFPGEFLESGLRSNQFEDLAVSAKPLKLGKYFMGTQEVISDDGFHYEATDIDIAKYLIYAQQPNSYIIKVPKSEIVIRKALVRYEKYLRNLKGQLFKTFFDRALDHRLAEILTHRVFEELELPEI